VKESNWFDRKFEFDVPLEVFPSVVERVRGTPARLEEMVRSYPAEILTRTAGDAWTIQQHVGHLYDLDELHEGRLDDFGANAEILRAADLANTKTEEANHNAASIEDLLAQFRAARMHFVKRLEAMDEASVARAALHPRLQKPMRIIDLAIFVAEHDDHHLAAITRLARVI
jgi:uncharacterized damage-inducible protein DinB